MTRKERNMDQFIQASRGENVFNGLSDNEQNLNMSSISRMDESTPSRNNVVSDDDRDGNSDRKISRQPTFSSFTPQPRYDEYSNYQVQNSDNQDQKSEERSNRNLYLSDAGMKPLLSSISGSNDNSEKLSKFIQYSNNHQKPESLMKSSEGTYPHFFISSDTKNFTVSSDGSKQYRSPTFEAISEEENMSPGIVDSPSHKRLVMDIDYPDKFIMKRATRRPPSIHAALSPDISLSDREIMNQNPKLIIAHYESIILNLNKDYEEVFNRNEYLVNQVLNLRTQVSDSNKLLLKLQEGKFRIFNFCRERVR
jgi:hypothetical protein